MSKRIFIFFVILVTSHAAVAKNINLGNGFYINASDKVTVIPAYVAGNLVNIVKDKERAIDAVFFSGDYYAVGPSGIKTLMKDLKADPNTLLKIKPQSKKDDFLYSFRSGEHIYWFSPRGGYLRASVESGMGAQYQKYSKIVGRKIR